MRMKIAWLFLFDNFKNGTKINESIITNDLNSVDNFDLDNIDTTLENLIKLISNSSY